tara:strand:- start:12 stop:248 length:237 start_codon:yes stop_codon:yes gene_type:complete
MELEKKLDWGYRKLILNEIDEYSLITFELQEFIGIGSQGLHICLPIKEVKKVIKFLETQVSEELGRVNPRVEVIIKEI